MKQLTGMRVDNCRGGNATKKDKEHYLHTTLFSFLGINSARKREQHILLSNVVIAY
jgi:hypothetical protein